jgi:hypothetical protein
MSDWDIFDFGKKQREEYQRRVLETYGAEAGAWIIAKALWKGATQAMVVEMYGQPADGTRRVTKTKTVETWKYKPLGARRYGFIITFENGICTGWEEKR